jgi:hypothetical protein
MKFDVYVMLLKASTNMFSIFYNQYLPAITKMLKCEVLKLYPIYLAQDLLSNATLGLTQPPIQWVPGVSFPQCKAARS